MKRLVGFLKRSGSEEAVPRNGELVLPYPKVRDFIDHRELNQVDYQRSLLTVYINRISNAIDNRQERLDINIDDTQVLNSRSRNRTIIDTETMSHLHSAALEQALIACSELHGIENIQVSFTYNGRAIPLRSNSNQAKKDEPSPKPSRPHGPPPGQERLVSDHSPLSESEKQHLQQENEEYTKLLERTMGLSNISLADQLEIDIRALELGLAKNKNSRKAGKKEETEVSWEDIERELLSSTEKPVGKIDLEELEVLVNSIGKPKNTAELQQPVSEYVNLREFRDNLKQSEPSILSEEEMLGEIAKQEAKKEQPKRSGRELPKLPPKKIDANETSARPNAGRKLPPIPSQDPSNLPFKERLRLQEEAGKNQNNQNKRK